MKNWWSGRRAWEFIADEPTRLLLLLTMVIMYAVPQATLWLPNRLYGG